MSTSFKALLTCLGNWHLSRQGMESENWRWKYLLAPEWQCWNPRTEAVHSLWKKINLRRSLEEIWEAERSAGMMPLKDRPTGMMGGRDGVDKNSWRQEVNGGSHSKPWSRKWVTCREWYLLTWHTLFLGPLESFEYCGTGRTHFHWIRWDAGLWFLDRVAGTGRKTKTSAFYLLDLVSFQSLRKNNWRYQLSADHWIVLLGRIG